MPRFTPLRSWGALSRRAETVVLPITDIDAFLDQPILSEKHSAGYDGHNEPIALTIQPGSPMATTVVTMPLSGARVLSPLQKGALEGDFEAVVCELVLKGADVNEKCSLTNQNNDLVEGVTPLYLAAQAGNSEMCRLLLRRGADARLSSLVVRTGERFTPGDVALTRGYVRLWWRLRRAAKSPNKSKVMAETLHRQVSAPQP